VGGGHIDPSDKNHVLSSKEERAAMRSRRGGGMTTTTRGGGKKKKSIQLRSHCSPSFTCEKLKRGGGGFKGPGNHLEEPVGGKDNQPSGLGRGVRLERESTKKAEKGG